MARRPSTTETSAARLVPCDKIICASQVATQSSKDKVLRQAPFKKSATTVNSQVLEFFVTNIKIDLHGLTAYLAIFDIGLSAGGQVNHDVHRFRAIRAADRPLDKQSSHVRIKAADAFRSTALH